MAGIVTAFTVAHSITLALAALKLVSLPSWFIEPAIAVTIVLAAIDNVWPVFPVRRVVVTFVFGLIHGFGFASVLAELNLPTADFAWALLQFNLGLEAGQLMVVVAATAVLFGAALLAALPPGRDPRRLFRGDGDRRALVRGAGRGLEAAPVLGGLTYNRLMDHFKSEKGMSVMTPRTTFALRRV